MAMMYSDKVLEKFKNPRNVGTMDDADGVGEIGNPSCGDIMTFYIKVKDEKIDEVRFQTFGCGAAIAVSSMISELALGKSVDDASKITNKEVAEALDGLPKSKMHCSNLGADALNAAITNYRNRQAGKDEAVFKIEDPHEEECACPGCATQVAEGEPICRKCGTEIENDH